MIILRQSLNGNKDPVIHVTVTNHASYLRDGVICHSVEEATEKIGRWLRNKINDATRSTAMEDDPSQIKRGGKK
jgi:hypothetical protein